LERCEGFLDREECEVPGEEVILTQKSIGSNNRASIALTAAPF